MKSSGRCPSCDCRRVWVIDPLNTIDESDELQHLPLAAAMIDGEPYWAGALEARVCDDCGYTELYGQRLDKLAKLAKHTPAVRLQDATQTASHRCSKCSSQTAWHIDALGVPVGKRVRPLPLAAISHDGDHYWAGSFSAQVCSQCGYTELRGQRVEKLHELADHSDMVRLQDKTPKTAHRD